MNDFIKFLFCLCLGSTFLSTFIWFRFIRERIPYELSTQIQIHILYIYLIILTNIIVCFIINLYLIYKEFIDTKQNNSSSIITQIFTKINEKLLSYIILIDIFFKSIIPKYDKHKNWLDFYMEIIGTQLVKKPKLSINIILGFYFSIKVLACMCFCIDVFVYKTIYFTYKIIPLLFIPLLIKYIIYSIKTSVTINVESLNNVLSIHIIKNKIEKKKISIYDLHRFFYEDIEVEDEICLTKEYILQEKIFSEKGEKQTLEYILSYMNYAFPLLSFFILYEKKKIKVTLIFNFFKYLIYICGWSYIILYGLGWLI